MDWVLAGDLLLMAGFQSVTKCLSLFLYFLAAGLQCSHLLLYKHCRRVYPLPSRGVPKTGFPGDQGMHTSQAAFSKGKPAAGKSNSWK